MNIQFLGNQQLDNIASNTCDEYRVSQIGSLDALLEVYQTIAARHPGCKPLLSLDDLGQARYTSGHARLAVDLDEPCEQDLAALPAQCFENGAHLGYLSTKAEFAICLRNLKQLARHTSFEDACAHGLSLDEAALEEWLGYQKAPMALIEQPLTALVVPVESCCEALAAFPNGYFESDLCPAQNFAVAQHFAQVHGYELIGVGAAYIGLLRGQPIDLPAASAVADDMCRLYNSPDEQLAAMAAVIANAIVGQRHLWLRYVE